MSELSSILLYVFSFLAAMLAVEGIYIFARSFRANRKTMLLRRLRRMAERPQPGDSLVRAEDSGSTGASLPGWLPQRGSLALLLYQAGSTLTPSRFLLASLLLAAAGAAAGWWIVDEPFAALPGVALGLLPRLGLGLRRRERQRRFEQQLPQAIELFTRALRAGHGMNFGFQMVGEELPDPIGTEFEHVAEEIALGMDLRLALANLARRVGTQDVAFLVTAILIQRETGGNLAEILDNLGKVIRDRLKFYGKVRALVAQTKASANILLVMPFVMVGALAAVNRDYVAPLWETEPGRWLLLISSAAVLVGYGLCRRLARVRV